MKKLFAHIKKNKYLLLLLYWPIHLIWYEVIRIYSDQMPRFYYVTSALDDYIPFCEWFIIPYFFWFLYMVIVFLYTAVKGKEEFLKAFGMVFGNMFVSMVISTVFPSGLYNSIRPDFASLGRDNILISLVKFLYTIDSPPRVVMPSMHVAVAVALSIVVVKSNALKDKRVIKISAVIMSILITLSTVFTKQHSILDVFAGLALNVPLYYFVYHIMHKSKILTPKT